MGAQELIIENYEDSVEIWVLIPYNTIIFGKDNVVARYQISVEITDQKNKLAFGSEESIIVRRIPGLEESAIPIKMRTQLDRGRYTASLVLKNKDLGGSTAFNRSIIIDDRYTEIGRTFIIGEYQGMRFIPTSWEQFQMALQSCYVYQRLSIKADSMAVKLIKGNDYLSFVIEEPRIVEQDILPLFQRFDPDDVTVTIYEANIQYRTAPTLYRPWFAYNQTYSLKDQLQQVRYVASANEWNTLRRLKDEGLALALDQFWEKHDPSPGTARNEAKEEFQRRILHADEKFTIHKRLRGWKSDLGRIYIKFGTPDDIVNEVFPIGQKPSITWYYFRKNKVFRFVDLRGYGDYRLENPDEEYDN